MSSIPAIQSALFGLRENLRHFDETATRIASEAPGGDLPGDLVGLKISKAGVAANVATVRAADEILGSLLDLLA